MAKDKKARGEAGVTVIAIANVVATLVDTMRYAEVPNDTVHHFLNQLERLNRLTLSGVAALVMDDVVAVVRGTVASND